MKKLLLLLALMFPAIAHADIKPISGNSGLTGIFNTILCDAAGYLNFDSATLYLDCVNNRVGIGTAAPLAKLHNTGDTSLVGAVTVGSSVTITNSGSPAVRLQVGAAAVGAYFGQTVTIGGTEAALGLQATGKDQWNWAAESDGSLSLYNGAESIRPIRFMDSGGTVSIPAATTFGSSVTVKGNLEASAATTVDLLLNDTAGAVGGWRLRAGNASANDAAFGSGNFTPYMGFNTTAAAEMNITATGGLHVTPASTYNSSGTWKNIVAATTFTITNLSSPAAADACTAGTITVDTAYIYVCSASGAWKRAALTGGY